MTPIARSMKWLRDKGFIVCRVEQRLHMPKSPFPITKDAFGFGDLLAADGGDCGNRIYLVQVTSRGNMSARRAKIGAEPLAAQWKLRGGRILLQGWSKKGPRGKRKTWQIEQVEL